MAPCQTSLDSSGVKMTRPDIDATARDSSLQFAGGASHESPFRQRHSDGGASKTTWIGDVFCITWQGLASTAPNMGGCKKRHHLTHSWNERISKLITSKWQALASTLCVPRCSNGHTKNNRAAEPDKIDVLPLALKHS